MLADPSRLYLPVRGPTAIAPAAAQAAADTCSQDAPATSMNPRLASQPPSRDQFAATGTTTAASSTDAPHRGKNFDRSAIAPATTPVPMRMTVMKKNDSPPPPGA